VWIPKYRWKIIKPGVASYLEKAFVSYLADEMPDVQMEEFNAQADHLHLLIIIPPKYAISTVVQKLKSHSSHKLKHKFDYLKARPAVWSTGYFVSSVGINEQVIRRYIKFQAKHDTGQARMGL
jgi:putative transposase